jgi:hypothetical protein
VHFPQRLLLLLHPDDGKEMCVQPAVLHDSFSCYTIAIPHSVVIDQDLLNNRRAALQTAAAFIVARHAENDSMACGPLTAGLAWHGSTMSE